VEAAVTYRLRRADAGDLIRVADLWGSASTWLAQVGSDQWQYPPRSGRIATSIVAGTCRVVEHAGAPVATITLDHYADPEFWTAADDPGSALYVHRMIVAERGTGLGSSLLDWAGAQAAAWGRMYVRLDAWKRNAALHSYYRDQRFAHVRTVDLPHRGSGALFQRHAAVRVGGGPELSQL
jgi:GNAT superfamily N-acetyltransferase